MKKTKINQWKDIESDYTGKLLLGNGASIAIWSGFHYNSLYEEAYKLGIISNKLKKLFDEFGTKDFELILKQLRQANIINKLLDINEKNTFALYKLLREALIEAIVSTHPKHENIKNCLLRLAVFMRRFHTVINLNYDLIVYWAFLRGNDDFGPQFKDGFIDEGRFSDDYKKLWKPYGIAKKTTMVFYPHGNLIFATLLSAGGVADEIKLSRSENRVHVLESIISAWQEDDLIPLFVSEGDTETKLRAIKRSSYLQAVYKELETESDTLALYGWAMSNDDRHILKALMKSKPKKIAISINMGVGDIESQCETFRHKISNMYFKLNKELRGSISPKIIFFDAQSKGCWNN